MRRGKLCSLAKCRFRRAVVTDLGVDHTQRVQHQGTLWRQGHRPIGNHLGIPISECEGERLRKLHHEVCSRGIQGDRLSQILQRWRHLLQFHMGHAGDVMHSCVTRREDQQTLGQFLRLPQARRLNAVVSWA